MQPLSNLDWNAAALDVKSGHKDSTWMGTLLPVVTGQSG